MLSRSGDPLPLAVRVDFDEAEIHGEFIDFSVDLDGVVTVLTADRLPDYRRVEGHVGYFQSFSRKPINYIAHIVCQSILTRIKLGSTVENFTSIRKFSPDFILLARGRTQENDPEDGVLVDFEGNLHKRIGLGDAIEHLFITPSQSIWVGYFDEGYACTDSFGGGIVLLNADGVPQFRSNDSEMDCIDSYAMTMDRNGTVHACTFMDFPIVSITTTGSLRRLGKAQNCGSDIIAVRGDKVLMSGGYDAPDKLFLQDLTTGECVPCSLSGDEHISNKLANCYSIDGTLYFYADRKIYSIEVPH